LYIDGTWWPGRRAVVPVFVRAPGDGLGECLMAHLFLKLCNDRRDKGEQLLIMGESLDPHHEMEIEIDLWKWGENGITNDASYEDNPKFGASKTTMDDIVVQKPTDRASAVLAQYCAYGRPIPFAVITCRKYRGEGDPLDYLTIELGNVMINQVHMAGVKAENGTHEITETVHLKYETVQFLYKFQDNTGESAQSVPFNFKLPENKSSAEKRASK
jgi:type VI secretion system Hcp family effector